MNLIFLDTETTSVEPTNRLIQLAYKTAPEEETVNKTYKPAEPISLTSMAVIHVTNEMVENKPPFATSPEKEKLQQLLKTHIFIAHNAPFDIQVLKNEGIETEKYIDTFRVAKHVLDEEYYALQYLRYSMGIYKVIENEKVQAHDALGDVLVLEKLFYLLFDAVRQKYSLTKEEEIIEKMLELTQTPVLLKNITFGKYRGKSFKDLILIDRGYLEWLYRSESKKPETLKAYLNV